MGLSTFVDYAHNGDSLDKLLQVVTSHQDGRISSTRAPGNKGESRRKDFDMSSIPTLMLMSS